MVVIDVQRGGPSTGLPTKTEQADLNQLFGASQGDYPRAILAPTDLVDCFYTVVEAFNLAEKYQCPVLIASDLLLSEHRESADPEDFNFDVPIERGALLTNGVPEGTYKRFAFTDSGISPRALTRYGRHGIRGGKRRARRDRRADQRRVYQPGDTRPHDGKTHAQDGRAPQRLPATATVWPG